MAMESPFPYTLNHQIMTPLDNILTPKACTHCPKELDFLLVVTLLHPHCLYHHLGLANSTSTVTASYGGGGKSSYRGSGNNTANMRRKLKHTIRKPKGRPPGSKNKPKPAIMDEQALKHVIIEIPAGCDVVVELIKFAEIHNVGLTVLSGSGSVTNVTLSHTLSNNAPSLTLNGTFNVLSLSDTYVKTQNCSSSLLPPNPSSFPGVVSSPGISCFTMCLAGTKGEIFAGVIAGKIIAASLVVVAALYKKPMFLRVLNNNETNNNSLLVDLSDVDEAVLKGATNDASLMALFDSFNNAMSSSSPLNIQSPNLPPT
ncbi:hypothetical protein K1719_014472 [Acacia pycnantha]|nr:hypothetical protein K1719_014472 [Acacia pycnantha]